MKVGGQRKTCHPWRKSQGKRQMKTVKSKMWQRQEECSKGLSKKAGLKEDRWAEVEHKGTSIDFGFRRLHLQREDAEESF